MRAFFGRTVEPMLKGLFSSGSAACVDNRPMGLPWIRDAGHRQATAVWLCLALALPAVRAGDRHDHDRARAAVQTAQVLPLAVVLERLQRTHPGQVLELELEREDGRWIYEVKLLQAQGQLLELAVDARTAQVIEVERKKSRRDDQKERGKPEPGREPPR